MVKLFLLLALLLLWRPGVAQDCDPPCSCIGTLAECSARPALDDLRFTSIPVVPPTTTRLVLTGNEISSLPSGAFSHLPALEELHLDNNQLSSLSPEFFDSLPNLRRLILDDNHLQLTPEAVFYSLTSLQFLSLRRCSLVELNGAVFSGLSALTNLSLSDNKLVSLSTNFIDNLPSLSILSLNDNSLQTLPDGFLEGAPLTTLTIQLQDNPLSCDCDLKWLADTLVTNPDLIPTEEAAVCQWPPHLENSPLKTVPSSEFLCYTPSVTEEPQPNSILTDSPYKLEVVIDGAPFPDVVWEKDGEVFNYTDRLFVTGYDASLMFSLVANGDGGEYSVTLTSYYGSVESISVTLSVTEATCVDGELTESHETDVDCGGQYCSPCSLEMSCLEDRDCEGDLVCLYSHTLPSGLLYISSFDSMAYTCSNSTVPEARLEVIMSTISSDLPFAVAGNSSLQELKDSFHSYITEALSVPSGALTGVSVSSVERYLSPLLQFEAQVVQNCEETVANLRDQIDSGRLKATIRTKEGQGNICYTIRINI